MLQHANPSEKVRTTPGNPVMCPSDMALMRVEALMLELCSRPCGNDAVLHALEYHLASGGSRNRAKLALSVCDQLGLDVEDATWLGTAVELLHNASLIQDDLQDNDALRRGIPSVWVAYGINPAIGLVDLMIASAFAAIAEVSDKKSVAVMVAKLQTAIAMTLRGQSLDLEDDDHAYTVDECLAVAAAKSGPLFALGLELPLMLAGYDEEARRAYDAACAFGAGYQISDDISDVASDYDSGCKANIVIALKREYEHQEAIAEASALALRSLTTAKKHARALPAGSGAILIHHADQLLDKLGRRNG